MAAVTTGSKVVEVESQIGSFNDRNLMIRVQMAIASRECSPQLFHDHVGRWSVQPGLAKLLHDIRLPIAIHTPPTVTLKTPHTQLAIIRVVPALSAVAAAFVMFTLSRAAVLLAGSAGCECGTARGRARVEYSGPRSRNYDGLSHCPLNSNRCNQSSTVDFTSFTGKQPLAIHPRARPIAVFQFSRVWRDIPKRAAASRSVFDRCVAHSIRKP
jgi:hypothetical protein